jgi:hypothetical protein
LDLFIDRISVDRSIGIGHRSICHPSVHRHPHRIISSFDRDSRWAMNDAAVKMIAS